MQSRLAIYFWRRRGVIHPAPTPAGVGGAKAGLSRAEIRSRLSRATACKSVSTSSRRSVMSTIALFCCCFCFPKVQRKMFYYCADNVQSQMQNRARNGSEHASDASTARAHCEIKCLKKLAHTYTVSTKKRPPKHV